MKSRAVVYQQKDEPFVECKYGTSTLGEAGCGVLATINAVLYLTGLVIDYRQFADWAGQTQYVDNVGSLHTICKDACKVFGSKYSFYCTEHYIFEEVVGNLYPKDSNGFNEIWNKLVTRLQNGEVAVGLVQGHFIAIVEYDRIADKVLVLDSAADETRQTTIYGDWKSKPELDYNTLEGSSKLKLRSCLTFLAKI